MSEKNLITIEKDLPKGVVLNADEWFDDYGQPLNLFVAGIAEVDETGEVKKLKYPDQYACTAARRHALDCTPGFQDIFLRHLFNHLARGMSYESFGGRFFISKSRKKQWEKDMVEWKIVLEAGLLAGQEKWEQMGIQIAEGSIQGNASVYNSMMKSLFREQYGESTEVRHQHSLGGKISLTIQHVASGFSLLEDDEEFNPDVHDITAFQKQPAELSDGNPE